MEDKFYTITLADGTVLDDLRMNGTTFVSEKSIDPTVFEENCSPVTISDGENEEVYDFMEYVPTAQPVTGEFWFGIRNLTERELRDMQLDANIEYLAMMTGVEL